MKICTTYGKEMPLRKESDMHEIRLDVFKKIPKELNDNSIITLCGKSIRSIPDWFNGIVDVGDNDINTEIRTMRSVHDYKGTPSYDDIVAMMKGGNHICKGAFTVNSFTDLHNIFRASEKIRARHVLVGMGKTGEITRIRSSLLGNEFTYGYCGMPTAHGQPTTEELESLGDDCTVVGLVGRSLSYSKSPAMHNAAMKELGINGTYLTFESPDLKHFKDVMIEYDIRGVNVTIPFKEDMMKHIDAASDESKEIGAVNTVINDNGELVGKNTDIIGIESVTSKSLKNCDRILILGSGGVARASAFVFSDKGKEISVVGRNEGMVSKIVRDFGAETFTGDAKDYDMIVNCTPIGLVEGRYPMDIKKLNPDQTVFDMVYGNDTPIVEEAKKKGCHIINGEDMLVAQGSASFELWFGKKPNTKTMRCAIQ